MPQAETENHDGPNLPVVLLTGASGYVGGRLLPLLERQPVVLRYPSPNALAPTFEAMFARMEPLADGTFALYAMRHTGKEWVGVLDALSADECLKAIEDDPWFVP